MSGRYTVVPSTASVDGNYIGLDAKGDLTFGNVAIVEDAKQNIDIIQLQSEAGVSTNTHDSSVTDTFTDATGYLDSVNTGNTTDTFDVNAYTNVTSTASSDLYNNQATSADITTIASYNGTGSKWRISQLNFRLNTSGTRVITLKDADTLEVLATVTRGGIGELTADVVMDFVASTKDIRIEYVGGGSFRSFNNGSIDAQDIGIVTLTSVINPAGSGVSLLTIDEPEDTFTEVDLPVFPQTVVATALIVNGNASAYEISDGVYEDLGLTLNQQNALVNLQNNPTRIRINSNSTEECRKQSYCLVVWYE